MSMAELQEFINKHGLEEVRRATGIRKHAISAYLNGGKPNQFNAVLLYNFSVKVGDPLYGLKPQEELPYVQLAKYLIRHNISPYDFSHQNGIPDRTFLDVVNGKADIHRVTPKTQKLIYEGTVKLGEPLEILRPSDYPAPVQGPVELPPATVPSSEHKIEPTPALELKEKLNRLFDDVVDLLPYLRDTLDPVEIHRLTSQQLQDKKEVPMLAKKLAYKLGNVLEYYLSAPPEEREEFRRIFYGDRRAIINLAQLIDSLKSEEDIERLKSLRALR